MSLGKIGLLLAVLLSPEEIFTMNSKSHNHLWGEKSPYLLQHADNPVDWYPWGEEAFNKAKEEDKPIFLSIGYSTCHWCHVMEEESFKDSEVAEILNKYFVSIKVDREERPDIDRTYMKVAQLLTGSGGWPLTIIMTPDKKPFFAATYLPKHTSGRLVGLLELLPKVHELWVKDRDELEDQANKIASALRGFQRSEIGKEPNRDLLDRTFESLSRSYDKEFGGFGSAPKFPLPQNLLFLMGYWKEFGNPEALQMVTHTLQRMRMGGIYDQVGFGFHRYSTDRYWHIPHFEKMLYDQAMMLLLYVEAYRATKNEDFKEVALELIDYLKRALKAKEGAFYSAEDADSDGKEGKFYLFTIEEIREILNDEAQFFIKVFSMKREGNKEGVAVNGIGENVLYMERPLRELSSELGIPIHKLKERIETLRERVFFEREKRTHPSKDTKILTDWNGLTIAALAKAGFTFNRPDIIKMAEAAANFILKRMFNRDGSIYHRYSAGEVKVRGFLDDYAFLSFGLLELYEATFKEDYLERVIALQDYLFENFWDNKMGGFFFTDKKQKEILVREKEVYDGPYPSGNSVEFLNLLKLYHMTGSPSYREKAELLAKAFSKDLQKAPGAAPFFMYGLTLRFGNSSELVIVADSKGNNDFEVLDILRNSYMPNVVVVLKSNKIKNRMEKIAPFTKGMNFIEGKPTFYLCRDFACNLPTTDPHKVAELLKGNKN